MIIIINVIMICARQVCDCDSYSYTLYSCISFTESVLVTCTSFKCPESDLNLLFL